MNGDELRHGLTVFGDKNTVGVNLIEQGQALLLKFSGGYGFHVKNYNTAVIIFLVIITGHNWDGDLEHSSIWACCLGGGCIKVAMDNDDKR